MEVTEVGWSDSLHREVLELLDDIVKSLCVDATIRIKYFAEKIKSSRKTEVEITCKKFHNDEFDSKIKFKFVISTRKQFGNMKAMLENLREIWLADNSSS